MKTNDTRNTNISNVHRKIQLKKNKYNLET